jgi:hypothetical protein
VALAAKTTVEKIMPYSAPVLAERAHVAERAQRSSVRRRSSEGSGSIGGGRTLEEAVAHHLRAQNVDPSTVEWDAFRREDGRWTLTGSFATSARHGTATFTFDIPGNYVTVDDEPARWLVGETSARASAAPPAATPTAPGPGGPRRRLSAVPAEQLPLGDDAIELVADDPGHDSGRPVEQPAASASDETADLSEGLPVEAFLDEEPPAPHAARGRSRAEREHQEHGADDDGTESPGQEAPAAKEQSTTRRPVRKNRGRASVPSWDEIMFGGGTGE